MAHRHFPALLLALVAAPAALPALAQDAASPMPVKVVVVTMFEIGQDTGDRPGEFQNWVERLPLDEPVAFPQGYRDLRLNREKGVLGMVTGIGTARAASSVMALGMDPRFDLSKAYWVVAGIAGADPEDMSLGSAAWAEWVIDGDLSHEIDPREAPGDWPTGYTPLRHAEPYAKPVPENDEGARYRLDPALVSWAYELTRDTELQDADALSELRQRYVNHPEAQKPPMVIKGDNLAASTFWHGKLLNDWANDWVEYWSEGQGNFVTTAMEDTGTLQSLTFLDKAGRVDRDRVLVLRTASNYSMQHEGITAAESLSGEKKGGYSAFIPSLDAAYRVGSKVVLELAGNWDRYADTLPGER
ncbi:purine nucleoside permease [Geminicoccaceae bacterium 1502E]|nr:purine nucleoside permease [Geminicoccaceae bacterium 1502E]